MLTCLALVAFNVASLGDIPKMTSDFESEARALSSVSEVTPDLVARIEAFSGEAREISSVLRGAGVGQDMPCTFQGIANDASDRAAEFSAADTPAEQDTAFMNLRVLMDDAVLLAPMAAAAAADRADERNMAFR